VGSIQADVMAPAADFNRRAAVPPVWKGAPLL
jgi:hypothetical protein